MIAGFDFIQPALMWFLLLLLPLAGLILLFEQRRSRDLLRLSNTNSSLGSRSGRVILPILVIFLFLTAIARPYRGMSEINLPRAGRDFMIILDVSKSMLAQDMAPSRLEFAKRKIVDLMGILERSSPGDRVGLVLFAGDAYLFAPLTADYSVFLHFVKAVDTELISSQGTSLKSAVQIAIESLNRSQSKDATLLLLSDGEDLQASDADILAPLKSGGQKLDVLGIGSPDGKPIPMRGGFLLKDQSGNIVITKLQENTLSALAQSSGGMYLRSAPSNYDLERLLQEVAARSPATSGQLTSEKIYNEFGHYLSLLLLTIVGILFYSGRASLLFALILLPALPPEIAFADQDRPLLTPNQAYEAYEKGDYNNALPAFEELLRSHPDDLQAMQALGSIYYKLGRYSEAADLFSRLSAAAHSGRESFAGSYNRGNSLLMNKQFEPAIAEYERALRIKPGDENTIYNRDLAKKLLEEKQEQQKQEQQNSSDQKDSQQNESQQNEQQKSESQQNNSEQNQHQNQQQNQQQEQQQQGESQDGSNGDQDGEKGQQNEEQKSGGQDQNEDQKEQSGSQQADEDEAQQSGTKGAQSGDKQQTQSENDQNEIEGEAQEAGNMDEKEARAWLKSLSDAPILYSRKLSKTRQRTGQTW